ncbi:hypothetical protein HY024_01965 [Candidatus Curtissbacteria bacterium]|nr:hypothetical protein [Candidatus Curtissbacteria bacterium]
MDFASKSKGIDYAQFEAVVNRILKDTDSVWNQSMKKVSLDLLGKPFENLRSTHLLYLRSISMFDDNYPAQKIVSTFKRYARDMGFGNLLSQIKIDDVDRTKKNPRAVCYWINPPQEVHLVIKPIGGEQDYEAMFHEGGHALHAASEDPAMPQTYKILSRSNALTEMYAFILEDLVFEPAWLKKYLGVDLKIGERIKMQAKFVNLMLLRRYIGKFLYEYQLFSGGTLQKGPEIYAKILQRTTGFVHSGEKYLNDMDGYFYSADYLRAWIGAAQFKDYLQKTYGQEWFFSARAGAFLGELWKDGVRDELEVVVKKLGYHAWDSKYLIRSYSGLG